MSFLIITCGQEPLLNTCGAIQSFIPEGTSAFVHTYSLHRDPRYFSPLPNEFLPERWLSHAQRTYLDRKLFGSQIHNTAAFIPFSTGPTSCPGKQLALMEIRMAICVIVSRFILKFGPSYYDPQTWFDDMCDYFIMVKGPLPTVLTPRQSISSKVIV